MCGRLRHKGHASDPPGKLQIRCVPLARQVGDLVSLRCCAPLCAFTPHFAASPYSLPNRRLDTLRLYFIPAQGFEEAKRALGGFHFVAVQSNPDADDVAGFWLLKEVAM